MRIPESVRGGLRKRLWAEADRLDWADLAWHEKSAHYESWTENPEVGGLLSNYMDHRRIRLYIKDTIMKGYVRSRQADPGRPYRALGLEATSAVAEEHERPHGRRLKDGRIIAWGSADDWKLVLTALHERSFGLAKARPYAAVLMSSIGKYAQPDVRKMVQEAADKLGIERLLWLE